MATDMLFRAEVPTVYIAGAPEVTEVRLSQIVSHSVQSDGSVRATDIDGTMYVVPAAFRGVGA